MAQKNLLHYIILGMLERSQMTGYDLKKMFETEIGEFWSAKHSQIYLELKHLEEQGYAVSETGMYGNNIEKTYYSITNKGKEDLDQWTDQPTSELPVSKDEFILKLYFIRDKNDPRIADMLHEQLMLHKAKLQHLKQRMEALFSDQSAIASNYGHYLILEHAVRREEEYVDWLRSHTHA